MEIGQNQTSEMTRVESVFYDLLLGLSREQPATSEDLLVSTRAVIARARAYMYAEAAGLLSMSSVGGSRNLDGFREATDILRREATRLFTALEGDAEV